VIRRQEVRIHESRCRAALGIEEDLRLGAQDRDPVLRRGVTLDVFPDLDRFGERIAEIDPARFGGVRCLAEVEVRVLRNPDP